MASLYRQRRSKEEKSTMAGDMAENELAETTIQPPFDRTHPKYEIRSCCRGFGSISALAFEIRKTKLERIEHVFCSIYQSGMQKSRSESLKTEDNDVTAQEKVFFAAICDTTMRGNWIIRCYKERLLFHILIS